MTQITKAVILMAGKGTRMMPATKAVAKELFPIGNTPALLYILKECKDSGIKEVCLIISKEKKAVKKFFKFDKEMQKLSERQEGLKLLKEITDNLKISFVYQGKMRGTGGATFYARKFTKDQPFLLLSGDDLFINKSGKPASLEIIETYNKTGKFVWGCKEVDIEKVDRYGIIKPGKQIDQNIVEVEDIVEKPKLGQNPSNLALLSRYILFPEVYKNIKKLYIDKNQEIKLPEAIIMEKGNRGVYAQTLSSTYYDLGNQLEFIKCVIEIGLDDQKISDQLKEYLKQY